MRLFALVLLLLALPAAAAPAENLLYALPAAGAARAWPAATASAGAKATLTADEAGLLTFALEGRAGDRAIWLLPLDSTLAAEFELSYRLAAANLAPGQEAANLFAVLRSRAAAGAAPPAAKRLALFAAAGDQGSELGRKTFSTRAGAHRLAGLGLELVCRDAGTARLTVQELRLTVLGNVPDPEELTRVLAAAPGGTLTRPAAPGAAPRFNQRPLPGLTVSATLPGDAAWSARLAAAGGVRLVSIACNLGGDHPAYPAAPPLWRFPDFFDYEAVDEALRAADAPGVLLWLDLVADGPPAWWAARAAAFGADLPAGEPPAPFCDLDPDWQAHLERSLRVLFAHLRGNAWEERVVGCRLFLGSGAELMPPPERAHHPAYATLYRTWLRRLYASDAALRTAWQQPDASLATATPPPLSEWPHGSVGLLIHPQDQRAGQDAWRFWSESWADGLVLTARLVRRLSHDRFLVGVGGGVTELLTQQWNNAYAVAPAGLPRLLAAPAVDFLITAASWVGPEGSATGVDQAPVLAARARGKFVQLQVDCPAEGPLGQRFGAPPTGATGATGAADTWLEPRRRLFAAALCRGLAVDLRRTAAVGLSRDEDLADLARYHAVLARVGERAAPAAGRFAVVVDPAALFALAPQGGPGNLDRPFDGASRYAGGLPSVRCQAVELPTLAWSRVGAPYDLVFASDLDPARYKLLIAHRLLRLSGDLRARLAAARAGGRTMVWSWADGLVGDQAISPKQQQELSGVITRMEATAGPVFLRPEPGLTPFLRHDRIGGIFGAQPSVGGKDAVLALRLAPRLVVTDPDAERLACYDDREADAGLAWRVGPDWRGLYSASPTVNWEVLQGAAGRAGLPLYLDSGDEAWFSDSFIAIHALPRPDGAKVRTVRLPAAQALYEVWRDIESPAATEHTVELAAGHTYLFFRGDQAAWAKLGAPAPKP